MASGVELATAYVSLVIAGDKITPGVKRAFGEAEGVADASGKTSGKRFANSFSPGIKGIGKALAGTFAAVKVVDFLKDSVAQASDLAESSSKLNAIFGEASGTVQKFAAGGAKALGQTKLDVLNAAATFGTFGKAAGLVGPDLAGFSTKLTGLSTDLASFFNTDPSQAAEAIGAALRGEAEPIRAYGVLLDDATLKAEALRLGLLKPTKDKSKILSAQVAVMNAQKKYNDVVKKSGKNSLEAQTAQAKLGASQSALNKATEGSIGPLTQQQKVLAAQSSIFKQTKDAQGDFAKTSGGLANQQRILSATVTDLKGKIGAKLLPVVLTVTKAAAKFFDEMASGVGTGGQVADVLGKVGNVLKSVGTFLVDHKKIVAGVAIAWLAWRAACIAYNVVQLVTLARTKLLTAAVSENAIVSKVAATAANNMGGAMRAAAGAAGIGLLAVSAKKSGSALNTLSLAAGGAAVGFAVAGPLGAGIGGTVGALVGFVKWADASTKRTKTLAETVKVSAGAWKTYTATLSGTSAALTTATRDMAYQKLQASGLLDATRRLGLTDREAVLAVTGNAAARQKMANALRLSTLVTDAQKAALAAETGEIGKSRLALLQKNVAIAGNANELRIAQGALKRFMAEPASKRVSITNVENSIAQLRGLSSAFRQVLSLSGQVPRTSGPGGIGALLGVPKAGGGPVQAGVLYKVAEHRDEYFRPNVSGRIEPRVPAGGGMADGQRLQLVLEDGTPLDAYVRKVSGAQSSATARVATTRTLMGAL